MLALNGELWELRCLWIPVRVTERVTYLLSGLTEFLAPVFIFHQQKLDWMEEENKIYCLEISFTTPPRHGFLLKNGK
jgi:hypothetical protein